MAGVPEVGLGAALVIALQVLKEVVLKALAKRNGSREKDAAGEQSTDYWQMKFKEMEDRICDRGWRERQEMEIRVMRRLDDLYAAMQTLIRWKGGD